MCGRYALYMQPSEVRRQFEGSQMPVEEAPNDDDVRSSYNFAPGYHGLIYRADVPDQGNQQDAETDAKQASLENPKYKLQAAQWGLVPFWTKRNPDYASKMKTINCRDDSLVEDRGMWTTMKKRKRCIIVAQGFFEWLKKNGGKHKLPHFTKRRDGQLMCFAGLWDCVQFEDSDKKLYTYSIITTDANKQLKFLHDRMPVILDNGSDAIRTWLAPNETEWTNELQSLLQPYKGKLDCYQVNKDVNKVGNNSPSFLVPINSAANKNNIANFFDAQKKTAMTASEKQNVATVVGDDKKFQNEYGHTKVEKDNSESCSAINRVQSIKDDAPLSVPPDSMNARSFKREHSSQEGEPSPKRQKSIAAAPPTKSPAVKTLNMKEPGRRNATSNGSTARPPSKTGMKPITSFFSKK